MVWFTTLITNCGPEIKMLNVCPIFWCLVSIIVCLCLEQFGLADADYYYYLNQSGCYNVDDVNDVKEYQDTRVCYKYIIVKL